MEAEVLHPDELSEDARENLFRIADMYEVEPQAILDVAWEAQCKVKDMSLPYVDDWNTDFRNLMTQRQFFARFLGNVPIHAWGILAKIAHARQNNLEENNG